MDTEQLNVLDIYLDTENPRHDPIKHQAEIIDYLIKNENVRQLAKDISEHGTSPLELIGVYKNKEGRYISLEGNRRLCALTLLNDPNKAPNGHAKYFEDLSKNGNAPTAVSVVVFNSRKDAQIWIDRRHLGLQDGVGVKKWDAIQKSRNRLNNSIKDDNALALALLDYAASKGFIANEDKKKKKILTTATRYLGNEFVRDTFGIVSKRNNPNVELNVPLENFDMVLERFCHDLMENTEVNSRSKKDDWVIYAKKLLAEGVATRKHIKSYPLNNPPKATNNPNTVNPVKPTTGGRGQQDPDKRKKLFDSTFRPTISNKTLKYVFNEIKKLDVDDTPLAVCLLTRVFLENIFRLYKEKHEGKFDGAGHEVLRDVIKILESHKKAKKLNKKEDSAFATLKKVQGNPNHIYSFKSFGAYAHAGNHPQPKDLKVQWDHMEPIIEYLLNNL